MRRLRSRMTGWAVAFLTLALIVAALVLLELNASRVAGGRIGAYGVATGAVLLYAGVGRLISSRFPGNAIGWLLSCVGLTLAASLFAEQYALAGLATAPGSPPAARLAGMLAGTAASATVAQLFFLVLLFPDGRLPSRRWRPLLWAMFAVMAGWASQQLQAGTDVTGGLTNVLSAAGVSYPNPLGVLPRHGWFSGFLAAVFVLAVVTGVLVVVSVFVRRRRAGFELRKQLAWLGYAGLLTAVWPAVLTAAGLLAPRVTSSWLGSVIWGFMVFTPVAGIPLACAVAVLKYRLYEIDRILSRTLGYAIVTGLLAGVYAGLVVLATQVLTFTTPPAVAVATLVAAALFSPLRRRVQRVVDRRFNRARYDADRAVAAFAARLQETVELNAVSSDLAGVVSTTLEPALLTVWIRPG